MEFKATILILFLVILKVMHAAEPAYPCPIEEEHIVANMCTDESTVEEEVNGYKAVDSVLLSINKQLNNCICHISLLNSLTNSTISMSEYKGLTKSAPKQQNCGLVVYVQYLDTSNTIRSLQSIHCNSGTSMRPIALGGSKLIFKSRIIDGDFTRGYCMQIHRNESINDCKMNDQVHKGGTDGDWIVTHGTQHTSVDECKQYCLQSKMCVAVHYVYVIKYCFVYNQTTTLIAQDGTTYSQKYWVDTQNKSRSFLVALVIAIIDCAIAVIFAGTTLFYKRQLLTQKSKSPLAPSVNYVDLSVARDVSDYSAINTQVVNEQYETVNART